MTKREKVFEFIKENKKAVFFWTVLIGVLVFYFAYNYDLWATSAPFAKYRAKKAIELYLLNNYGINADYPIDDYGKNYIYGTDPYLEMDADYNIVSDGFAMDFVSDYMDEKINRELAPQLSPCCVKLRMNGHMIRSNPNMILKDIFCDDGSEEEMAAVLEKYFNYGMDVDEIDCKDEDKAVVWYKIMLYLHKKGYKPNWFRMKDERRYLPEIDYHAGEDARIEKVREWIYNSKYFH
ncbi:MAG: hypothetical protein IJL89_00725 [Firmicutes bacterium]|nr:hypothetical protein [Bacillota bacterium]